MQGKNAARVRPSAGAPTKDFVSVWRYRVRTEKTDAYLRAYGQEGGWVELFRRAEGYISTELLRDAVDPAVFVTIDRWESHAAYDMFRRKSADEYLVLDTLCSGFTEDEELVLEGGNT